MLKDKNFEELTNGIMEQFRIVKSRPEDIETEIRIADSMSNMAGKVVKMYMVELAYKTVNEPTPLAIPE